MKLKTGQVIEYVADVFVPASQAGKKGDRRTVGSDITAYAAHRLTSGPCPYAVLVNKPEPQVKAETKPETKPQVEPPAEKPAQQAKQK